MLLLQAWSEAFEEAAQLSTVGSVMNGCKLSKPVSFRSPLQQQELRVAEAGPGGWRAFLREARRLGRTAATLSVSSLGGFVLGLIALSSVGRLGEYELSVAVLATSIFNVTGLSLLVRPVRGWWGHQNGIWRWRLLPWAASTVAPPP